MATTYSSNSKKNKKLTEDANKPKPIETPKEITPAVSLNDPIAKRKAKDIKQGFDPNQTQPKPFNTFNNRPAPVGTQPQPTLGKAPDYKVTVPNPQDQSKQIDITNLPQDQVNFITRQNQAITEAKQAQVDQAIAAQAKATVQDTPARQALDQRQQDELAKLNILLQSNNYADFQAAYEQASPEVQSTITSNPDYGQQAIALLSGNPTLAPDLINRGAKVAGVSAAVGAAAVAAPEIVTSLAAVGATTKSLSSFGGKLLGAAGVGGVAHLLTGGKQSELEGDITSLSTASRNIVTDVSNGADPNQAIETLNLMEQEIRATGDKLAVATRYDPQAWLKGKNINEFMFQNLNSITRRRQAIERYVLDGDVNALQRSVGTEFPQ